MVTAILPLCSHIGFEHGIDAGLIALLAPGLEMVEHGFFDPQGHMLGSVRLDQLGVGPESRIGFRDGIPYPTTLQLDASIGRPVPQE